MKQLTEYVAPEIEVLEVEVEAGFVASGETPDVDPGTGGDA